MLFEQVFRIWLDLQRIEHLSSRDLPGKYARRNTVWFQNLVNQYRNRILIALSFHKKTYRHGVPPILPEYQNSPRPKTLSASLTPSRSSTGLHSVFPSAFSTITRSSGDMKLSR